MMERLTIVKVGGAVVEDTARLGGLLDRFAAIGGKKILVHGGGRAATEMATRLGMETKMVDGRRITDKDTLQVATMVYAGLVNKNIVAALQARKTNAVGLTGADMGLILGAKRAPKDGVDYGYVGDIRRVDATRMARLLDKDAAVPVIAPLTHDGAGTLLNTNADSIAASVAKAMCRLYDVTLVYCFEKPGVLADPENDASVIRRIDRAVFERLKADGTVVGGMLPKVENALESVENGVGSVVITQAENIGDNAAGTEIVKEA